MTRHVFVRGLTPVQREELATVHESGELQFHDLLDHESLVATEAVDFEALLERARAELDQFDGSVDAIVSDWDFPTSVLGPVLAAERGLPGPSLTSLLKLEHKYWSRLEQRQVVPEVVPGLEIRDDADLPEELHGLGGSGCLTIHPAESVLRVPVRPRQDDDATESPFHEPAMAPEVETTILEPSEHDWRVTRDLASDVSTLEIVNDQGAFRIEETGMVIRRSTTEWYSFRWDDVTSVRGETCTVRRIERDDWRTEVVTRTVLTCTEDDFIIRADLDAYELDDERGHRRVHSESWDRVIARDLV